MSDPDLYCICEEGAERECLEVVSRIAEWQNENQLLNQLLNLSPRQKVKWPGGIKELRALIRTNRLEKIVIPT